VSILFLPCLLAGYAVFLPCGYQWSDISEILSQGHQSSASAASMTRIKPPPGRQSLLPPTSKRTITGMILNRFVSHNDKIA